MFSLISVPLPSGFSVPLLDSPSSSQMQLNSRPTTSQEQQSRSPQSEMQPDIRQSDNSSGQSQMPSTKEMSRNAPEQCSCIKGKMACLPSDDDGSTSMHENESLKKQLARSKELALVYRGEVNSMNRKITKLLEIIHAMIEIDKKAVVNEGEEAPEIKSDFEKLQKFRLLALEAETLLKKINNDGDKKVKNDKADTEDNEEETEDSEEETESSDEEAESNEEDMDSDEKEDLKEAIRRSLSEGIGSSSKMGAGSVEAGSITSRCQFYNSNNRQGSNLVGSSESGSSSCQTNLQQDSVKLKSTADAPEIMKLNKNEAELMQRKRKRDTDWGSEEDILCALTSKPEMLLEAVCALYRTERQRRICRIEVPYRRPTDKEFEMLTRVAIILMEGKMSGPNKKTAEELEKYIGGGFDFCAWIVGTCSTQLFLIYSGGWDDHFC